MCCDRWAVARNERAHPAVSLLENLSTQKTRRRPANTPGRSAAGSPAPAGSSPAARLAGVGREGRLRLPFLRASPRSRSGNAGDLPRLRLPLTCRTLPILAQRTCQHLCQHIGCVMPRQWLSHLLAVSALSHCTACRLHPGAKACGATHDIIEDCAHADAAQVLLKHGLYAAEHSNVRTIDRERWLKLGSAVTCSLNPFPSPLSSLLRYTTSSTDSCEEDITLLKSRRRLHAAGNVAGHVFEES